MWCGVHLNLHSFVRIWCACFGCVVRRNKKEKQTWYVLVSLSLCVLNGSVSALYYLHSVSEDRNRLTALIVVYDGVVARVKGAVLTSVGECYISAVGVLYKAIVIPDYTVVAVAVGGVSHGSYSPFYQYALL